MPVKYVITACGPIKQERFFLQRVVNSTYYATRGVQRACTFKSTHIAADVAATMNAQAVEGLTTWLIMPIKEFSAVPRETTDAAELFNMLSSEDQTFIRSLMRRFLKENS